MDNKTSSFALKENLQLEDYTIINQIGKGGNSLTYRAKSHKNIQSYCIIKEFIPHDFIVNKQVERSNNGLTINFTEQCDAGKQQIIRDAINKLVDIELANLEKISFISYNGVETNNPIVFKAGIINDKQLSNSVARYIAIETEAGECLNEINFPDLDNAEQRVIDKLQTIIRIAETVQKVHECGLLHCDLKPDNIFISTRANGDEAKIGNRFAILLDYGSALSMLNGVVECDDLKKISSSEHYQAPELYNLRVHSNKYNFQENISKLGAHSDIYSLCIIMLQLFADQRKIPDRIASESMLSNPDIAKLSKPIQRQLGATIQAGLNSGRKKYSSVREFISKLESIINSINLHGITAEILASRSYDEVTAFLEKQTSFDLELLGDIICAEISDRELKDQSILAAVDYLLTSDNKKKHGLIVADGGAGKTTQLRYLQKLLFEKEGAITPIYIPLYEVSANGENGIKDYIIRKFCGSASAGETDEIRRKNLEEIFKNHKHLLIIDGVNEIDNPNQFLFEINKLTELSALHIFVASKTELDWLKEFSRFKIAPLSASIISKKLGQIGITPNQRQLNMLIRPMYFAMYLRLQLDTDIELTDINTPGEIFIAEIERLANLEARALGRGDDWIRATKCILSSLLPAITYKLASSYFAYDNIEAIIKSEYDNFITASAARNRMAIKNTIGQVLDSETLITLLLNKGLLEWANDDNLRFCHQNIFMFYQALYIKQELVANATDTIPHTIANDFLIEEIRNLIGDIIGEYKYETNCTTKEKSPIEEILHKCCLGKTTKQAQVAVFNCLEIMKNARNNHVTADYSGLDLSISNFYGCHLPNSKFNNSIIAETTFSVQTGGNKFVCISPDKQYIYTADEKSIHYWDAHTGEYLNHLDFDTKGDNFNIELLDICPDGNLLAVTTYSSKSSEQKFKSFLTIENPFSEQKVIKEEMLIASSLNNLAGYAKGIISYNDFAEHEANIVMLPSNKRIFDVTKGARHVQSSPDGHYIMIWSNDFLELYDCNGNMYKHLEQEKCTALGIDLTSLSVLINAESQRIIFAGKGFLQIHDLITFEKITDFNIEPTALYKVQKTCGNGRLLTLINYHNEAKACVWDMADANLLFSRALALNTIIDISDDATMICALGQELTVFDAEKQTSIYSKSITKTSINHFAYIGENKKYMIMYGNTIKLIANEKSQYTLEIATINLKNLQRTFSFEITEDGKKVGVCAQNYTIEGCDFSYHIADLKTKEINSYRLNYQLNTSRLLQATANCIECKLSADGKNLAYYYIDDSELNVHVVALANGREQVWQLPLTNDDIQKCLKYKNHKLPVAFNGNLSQFIYIANNKLHLMDITTSTPKLEIDVSVKTLNYMFFSADMQKFVYLEESDCEQEVFNYYVDIICCAAQTGQELLRVSDEAETARSYARWAGYNRKDVAGIFSGFALRDYRLCELTDITVKFDSQLNELVLNGRHGNFEVYNIDNGEQIISRAFPELSSNFVKGARDIYWVDINEMQSINMISPIDKSKFVLIDAFNIDGCVFDDGKLVVGGLLENGGEISD